jgi:hypothetical protein
MHGHERQEGAREMVCFALLIAHDQCTAQRRLVVVIAHTHQRTSVLITPAS